MTDPRSDEEYFRVIREWASPDDLRRLLDLLGNPKSAEEFHASLKTMVVRQRWIADALQMTKEAALWIAAVGAAGGILSAIAKVWGLL